MPPMEEIIKKAFSGIKKAQKEYEYWSGTSSLWWAPEYLLTTYIAQRISRLDCSDFYVTLEEGVRGAIDEAGGIGRGRPPEALVGNGRFDILLWEDETPRVAIEVKNQVGGYAKLRDDVVRICDVLRRADGFRDGLVILHTSNSKEGDQRGAYETVSARLDTIKRQIREEVPQRGCTLHRAKRRIMKGQDRAWAAAIFHIGL